MIGSLHLIPCCVQCLTVKYDEAGCPASPEHNGLAADTDDGLDLTLL